MGAERQHVVWGHATCEAGESRTHPQAGKFILFKTSHSSGSHRFPTEVINEAISSLKSTKADPHQLARLAELEQNFMVNKDKAAVSAGLFDIFGAGVVISSMEVSSKKRLVEVSPSLKGQLRPRQSTLNQKLPNNMLGVLTDAQQLERFFKTIQGALDCLSAADAIRLRQSLWWCRVYRRHSRPCPPKFPAVAGTASAAAHSSKVSSTRTLAEPELRKATLTMLKDMQKLSAFIKSIQDALDCMSVQETSTLCTMAREYRTLHPRHSASTLDQNTTAAASRCDPTPAAVANTHPPPDATCTIHSSPLSADVFQPSWDHAPPDGQHPRPLVAQAQPPGAPTLFPGFVGKACITWDLRGQSSEAEAPLGQ